MTPPIQVVIFRVDGQSYAVALASVERIVRAVEVTSLPHAPLSVLGVINVSGNVLPVFNLRRCFGLPERELGPSDQLMIARTSRRTVVLVIDEVVGVVEQPAEQIFGTELLLPGVEQIKGVLKLPSGLVLIQDMEELLSQQEELELDRALELKKPAHEGGGAS